MTPVSSINVVSFLTQQKIPQGDWFCPKCHPPEKKSRTTKNRRLFSQDSDEEEVQKEKPHIILKYVLQDNEKTVISL